MMPPSSPQNGRLVVGSCFVEPQLNRIERDGQILHVEPKMMQVLLCLLDTPNEVKSKDQLIAAVWGDQGVTDDVLARAISALRKSFNDDPRHPTYIETIRKKGYRLIAAVEHAAPQRPQAPSLPPTTQAPAPASSSSFGWQRMMGLAVIGLVLLSGIAWFARPDPPAFTWPKLVSYPLTTAQGLEITPSLSPDGDYIAYSATPDSANEGNIFVQLLDQGRPHQLTHHSAHDASPAWSPDGNFVAFMRHDNSRCAVFVTPLIGGTERKVGTCGENRYADLVWSPDGQWLAFNSRESQDEAFAIYLLAADGSGLRRITEPDPSIWGDYDPAFSPDSRTLAFSRSFSEGLQDLFTVSLDDEEEQRVTRIGRNMYGISWLDTRTVLFSSNQAGTYDLWQIDTKTHRQDLVHTAPLDQVNPTWHAGSQKLIVEQRVYDMNLRTVSRENPDASPALLAASTQWDLHPRVSPSGSHLAFTSNRSGNYEVWVSAIDGSTPQQITSFGGPFTGTPRWAHDSDRLVFDARPEGHADVYLTALDGSAPIRLTSHPADDLAPSWSRDGQWVYFASNRTGAWEVWKKAPRSDATPEQVTMMSGFQAFESVDGTTLYYTKHPEDGIWTRSQESNTEQLLVANMQTSDWGNWAVHENGIYYVERLPGGTTPIAFYDFTTGTSTSVHHPSGYIPTQDPAFATTPDGQTFVYGLVDQRASDLLLLSPFQ